MDGPENFGRALLKQNKRDKSRLIFLTRPYMRRPLYSTSPHYLSHYGFSIFSTSIRAFQIFCNVLDVTPYTREQVAERIKEKKKVKLHLRAKWRPDDDYERAFETEMEKLTKVATEVTGVMDQLETSLELSKIRFDQSVADQITERYYDPIAMQLHSMATFHSKTILAQKVFDKISDESVFMLLDGILSHGDRSESIRILHYSFDNLYWKGRYVQLKKTCYIFDWLIEPEEIGLLQFYQLYKRWEIMRIGGGKMWNVPGFPDEIGRRGFGNVGCQYFIHTYGRYNGRFVCRAPGRKYKSGMNLCVGKIENIGSEFKKPSVNMDYHLLPDSGLMPDSGLNYVIAEPFLFKDRVITAYQFIHQPYTYLKQVGI